MSTRNSSTTILGPSRPSQPTAPEVPQPCPIARNSPNRRNSDPRTESRPESRPAPAPAQPAKQLTDLQTAPLSSVTQARELADPTAPPLSLPDCLIFDLLREYPQCSDFRAGVILFSPWDLLMVKESASQRIGFPKGAYESSDGGSLRSTALREFFEETGVNPYGVFDTQFVSTITIATPGPSGVITDVIVYFVVFVPEKSAGSIQLRKPKTEIAEVFWLPISEHHTIYRSSYTREALRKFLPTYAEFITKYQAGG